METKRDRAAVERLARARTSSGLLVAAIGASIGNRLPVTTFGVDATTETLAYGCAGIGLLVGWLTAPILVKALGMLLRLNPPKVENPRGVEADASGSLVVVGLLSLFLLYRELTATDWTKGILVFVIAILNAFFWSMMAARRGF